MVFKESKQILRQTVKNNIRNINNKQGRSAKIISKLKENEWFKNSKNVISFFSMKNEVLID